MIKLFVRVKDASENVRCTCEAAGPERRAHHVQEVPRCRREREEEGGILPLRQKLPAPLLEKRDGSAAWGAGPSAREWYNAAVYLPAVRRALVGEI